MPIDPNIALGFKQPDNMQTLSSLVNVARGVQDLQQKGIDLQERQAMQQVLSNPANYTDEQGAFDLGKAQSAIMKAAPTTGAKYISDITTAHNNALTATRTLNSLTSENRAQIGGVLASVPKDAPREVVHGTVDALNDQYGGRLGPLVNIFKSGYDAAMKKGGQQAASDFILRSARGVLPQETQQSMDTPAGVVVSDGTTSKLVNTRPGVQGIPQGATVQGTEARMTVGPGGLESIETDAQGNKHIVTRTTGGAITGTRPLDAVPGPSGAPSAPGPFRMPPGETPESLKYAQGVRTTANQAAATVPQQQYNYNQIVKLADEADLGKGAQILAGMGGQWAGIPWSTDRASAYNQLGHYLSLQTSQLAMSSGLGGTDAGRAVASEQAGNRDWTKDALKQTSRVNRALSTGVDLFNRGVENAVQTTGNPFAARDFQNQWSKTASVDSLRLYDAMRNKDADPEGFASTLKEFGGVNSSRFKATLQKVDEMRKLIKGQ